MTETVADWIVSFLDEQGVEFIFSHPGGPVLPFYEALRKSGAPKNVLVRHEGAGSFMADAYAKVTGRVGICMSTMGPGAANMTIGVGTAMSDSTPLMAITGQLALGNIGRGYQQETDHHALYKGITKASLQLEQASSAAETFERAYRIAVSGRAGPVHLDAPVDVSSSELTRVRHLAKVQSMHYGPAPEERVAEAWRLIAKAATPVILAGGGVILGNASVRLKVFAETLGIPVATSYNGRGSIPEDHPLALGRVGESTPSYCRKLVSMADLIIAIGYRFTDVSIEGWKPAEEAKIIQVDIEPSEIGRNRSVDVGLVGDAGATLEMLLKHARGAGRSRANWVKQAKEERAKWKQAYAKVESSDVMPIKPQRVMRELSRAMGKQAIVCSGAGRSKMWAASVLPIYGPRTWISSGGYAPMGYELCAAFASKLARPEKTVVSVGGDASFQMHCQEIATTIEYKSPFAAVVLNDMSLGSIKNIQLKKYGKIFGTELSYDVDLSSVSHAFGGDGERVTKPSELGGAVERALKSEKLFVLDIAIDGSEVPTLDY